MAGLQLLTAFLLAVVSTVQGKLPYESTALQKCPWNFTFAYWIFRTKAITPCDFHTFYTRLQICSAVRLFHESRKIFGSSFFLRRTSMEIYWGKKQALLHVFVHWKALASMRKNVLGFFNMLVAGFKKKFAKRCSKLWNTMRYTWENWF